MTSREDLLDQYIDALNNGNVGQFELPDDPELRELFQTAQHVKAEINVEWPDFDLPGEMSRVLHTRLTQESSTSATHVAFDDEPSEQWVNHRASSRKSGSGRGTEEEQNGWRWYSKQFAGMAAVTIVVGLFALGLASLYGSWGDDMQPGAAGDDGEIVDEMLPIPTEPVDDLNTDEFSDEMLELMRQGAERYISDEDDPVALTINGKEITVGQIEFSQANVEFRRINMQEMSNEHAAAHPPMAAYNEGFIDLIDEYGPESVGLGTALMHATVQVYAEENDLLATDEQLEEAMQQQREMHEMMEQQASEMDAAVTEAQIEVIGEDRYWNEFLPNVLTDSITEQNVDYALWEAADIEPEPGETFQLQRELFSAEFRAELVEEATTKVVDESALGDADLDRAIEYITEAYPALQQERVEWQREQEQGEGSQGPAYAGQPPVPSEGLQSPEDVESYLQELFAMNGYPDAEVVEIGETTREDVGTFAYTAPHFGDPEDPLWEVETRGYVPGPFSSPGSPVFDEGVDPPAPEDTAAIIWLDPSTGILPFFDVWDMSRTDDLSFDRP